MILIRRATDSKRAYTVIMLPGEPAKWIPTSDYEHQRILEIYLQDKYYEGIENDFNEFKKKHPKIAKDHTFESYKQTRIKITNNFLYSVLDKEKYSPILEE